MIITLVAAATALVALTTGYVVSRKRGPASPSQPARAIGRRAEPSKSRASSPRAKPSLDAAIPAIVDLPLSLGDVIVSGTEERWLAGGLIAREKGRVISALFLAPEGASTRAVAVFALPRTEIFWLDPADVDVPSEPPATIEIAGAMLTRRGRLPVSIERVGQGAPRVGESVLWASYEGSGREVAIVLGGEGRAHAWTGRRLDADEYERFGSGGSFEPS